ncbi:hypothetical protein D3C86_1749450 [compost metagenome]
MRNLMIGAPVSREEFDATSLWSGSTLRCDFVRVRRFAACHNQKHERKKEIGWLLFKLRIARCRTNAVLAGPAASARDRKVKSKKFAYSGPC